jgi:hypothetical protein
VAVSFAEREENALLGGENWTRVRTHSDRSIPVDDLAQLRRSVGMRIGSPGYRASTAQHADHGSSRLNSTLVVNREL